MSCDGLKATEGLENELILKPFRRFTYVTAHSPTLALLHLHQSSSSNLSLASRMLQALHLRHLASRPWCKKGWGTRGPVSDIYELSSFSNLFVTSPTSQLILQPFRRFTYATAHSPTRPLFHVRHSSFSNPSVASPTSQLILQPYFLFSYVTGSSLTSPGEPPMM